MKHHHMKRAIAAVASIVFSAGTLPYTPLTAFAASSLIASDFENGSAFPGVIINQGTGYAVSDCENGSCNITIYETGSELEDCQFIYEGLKFVKGHRYHLHTEVTADQDGSFNTYIGTNACDPLNHTVLWRNRYQGTEDAVGYESVDELDSWKSQVPMTVSASAPLVIDAEFTSNDNISNGVWSFMLGHSVMANEPAFPYAAVVSFDNISLIDLDGTETVTVTAKRENAFHVNQVGYLTDGIKRATLHSDKAITAEQFYLVNAVTKETVLCAPLSQISQYTDLASGMYTASADFSNITLPGSYYLSLDGDHADSYTFQIGENIYSGLTTDALNYFYLNRAGTSIRKAYVSNPGMNETADVLAHNQFAHYPDSAFIQNKWFCADAWPTEENEIEMDSGQVLTDKGWYDADTFSKNVPNGAQAVWMLQNMYEWASANHNADAYADNSGLVLTNETGDGIPDILNEARFELEFLHDMIVPERYQMDAASADDTGEYADMVFYQIQDQYRTDLAVRAWEYDRNIFSRGNRIQHSDNQRIVQPPATYATLSASAVFAQAARLFEDCDSQFAKQMLEDAKKTYAAAKKNPNLNITSTREPDLYACMLPMNEKYFFWAAAELYITTGNQAYLNDMKAMITETDSPFEMLSLNDTILSSSSFNETNPSGLGLLSLSLHPGVLDNALRATMTDSIVRAADAYLEQEANEGFGVPYRVTEQYDPTQMMYQLYTYEKGSNAIILNNGIVLAYANMLTGEQKYLDGAVSAMDYIFGRNAMDTSYVTAYGSNAVSQPTHNFWAHMLDSRLPYAPGGVLVGGAYSFDNSPAFNAANYSYEKTPAQCCYVDHIRTKYMNQCRVSWNASLAWMAGLLEKHELQPSTPFLAGDLSRNGKLDTTDIAILLHYLSGDLTMTETYFRLADMNGDKAVNAKDLTLLKRALLAVQKETA